jgi:hypothetical protein
MENTNLKFRERSARGGARPQTREARGQALEIIKLQVRESIAWQNTNLKYARGQALEIIKLQMRESIAWKIQV